MAVKINSLEFENVKRIKAVSLTPTTDGLTVIGGKNAQGKTSVLDAIAWAVGGDKYKPSEPKRQGSYADPRLRVVLSNGIVVERSGKNSALKVIDPNGNKGGQQLLNSFIESFALDIPKFIQQSDREKADTLLRIIGVGDKLHELEHREMMTYNERTAIGRIAEQKDKFAKEMPVYTNVHIEPVSVSELIRQQQDILARNGENERLRRNRDRIQAEHEQLAAQVAQLEKELDNFKNLLKIKDSELDIANKTAKALKDESTAEIEQSIREIEDVNAKVRANLERQTAEKEAEKYRSNYDKLTEEITAIRLAKRNLLQGANLPLDGLSVEDGALIYNGSKWDCMSGAEQMIVATSIVRRLNPECGFVLIDKLEQLDSDTLRSFGAWLEAEGLQAIATKVSDGDDCTIIIEDGMSREPVFPATNTNTKWGKPVNGDN